MGRLGAFSALQQQHNPVAQDSDEPRGELAALREGTWRKGSAETENELPDRDDRDEAGFPVDPTDPFVYVSATDGARKDAREYEVVHTRIAIRKRPSVESRVLGTAEKGEILNLYDWDKSHVWRKLHYRLRGGWGSLVEAWVMVRHQQLGSLLKPVGDLLPEDTPAEPAAPAAVASTAPSEPLRVNSEGAGATPAGPAVRPRPAAPGPAGQAPSTHSDAAASAATAAAAVGRSLRLLNNTEVLRIAEEVKVILASRQTTASLKLGSRRMLSELDILKGRKEESDGEDDEQDLTLPLTTPSAEVLLPPKELLHAVETDGERYEVVRRPFTAIRSQPSTNGQIVGTGEFGQVVDTFGWDETQTWRKVFCQSGHADELGGSLVAAWMLVTHPELGPLLRPVAASGVMD